MALPSTDLGHREQDEHPDPGDSIKRAGDRGAGIATGGRQDRQSLARFANEAANEPRHHPGGKILERGRGSAVETQDMNPVVNPLERHLKIISVRTQRLKRGILENASGESAQNCKSNLRIRLTHDFRHRQPWKFFRQI